jgi:cysteinyl-tRNA synthetase
MRIQENSSMYIVCAEASSREDRLNPSINVATHGSEGREVQVWTKQAAHQFANNLAELGILPERVAPRRDEAVSELKAQIKKYEKRHDEDQTYISHLEAIIGRLLSWESR